MSTVVILNGVPRSGKSSIARAIQESFDGVWLNLGVDVFLTATPANRQPGIGLRPGGERPDLEDYVAAAYRAMFASIAAHVQQGLNVVTDVGLHDGYSEPLGIQREAASILQGLSVLFVGVHCPVDIVRQRRRDTWGGTGVAGMAGAAGAGSVASVSSVAGVGSVASVSSAAGVGSAASVGGAANLPGVADVPGGTDGTGIDDPVLRWERAVHSPGRYDFEVDTSRLTPQACAERIATRLRTVPPPPAAPSPSTAPSRSAAPPPSAFFDFS